jgi:valyl-tRNA synthetase
MNSIKEYKFNDAADVIYQFIWKDYCDWYIEFIKPILSSRDNESYLIETRYVSINVMKNVILMLHPIMPYLTEEIFEKLFKSTKLVISSSWPNLMFEKKDLSNNIDLSIKLISEIRSLRVEKNIPLKSKLELILKNVSLEKKKNIIDNSDLITNLAKLEKITFSNDNDVSNDKFIISTVDEITLMISVEGSIDVDGERKRLNKELSNIKDEIEIIGKRLDNPEFVNKAPPKVVNEVKEKQGIYKKKKEEIEKALISL